jgi:hypothetical protein
MKATMSSYGVLTITAENGTEAFALRIWSEQSRIQVDDQLRMLQCHIDPRLLLIDARDPETESNEAN